MRVDASPGEAALRVLLGPDAPIDAGGAAVYSAALQAGLGADRSTRVRATVEELLGEARHRECVDGAGDLEVSTRSDEHSLIIEVLDHRLPLAPGGARRLTSRRLAALGFVDHLHVASRGADGNIATIEVHREDPDAAALGGEVLAPDVARASDAEVASLEIREMRDGDSVGVAQCVYRCYGYTYLDPSMYRPRSLRAWHRSGVLRSVVAVTPDGEVVGHSALTFDRPGAPLPEAGKLVVDPRYRGHHLAEALATKRLEVARGLELSGIWSECVTNHPYSQKEVAAFGGIETGLLIAATPVALTMQGLENAAGGRHSLLAMWTAIDGAGTGAGASRIHIGARHEPLMRELVGRSGLDRQVHSAIAAPATTHSHLRVSHDVAAGVGAIRVDVLGGDLVERVAHELDALVAYEPATVQVDVDLGDPAAGWAVEHLETLGCCFGAWLPGARGTDVLRLQRVGDVSVAGDVRCARPEGESIRDEVLSEWHRVRR